MFPTSPLSATNHVLNHPTRRRARNFDSPFFLCGLCYNQATAFRILSSLDLLAAVNAGTLYYVKSRTSTK